jgi:hypothetical protein
MDRFWLYVAGMVAGFGVGWWLAWERRKDCAKDCVHVLFWKRWLETRPDCRDCAFQRMPFLQTETKGLTFSSEGGTQAVLDVAGSQTGNPSSRKVTGDERVLSLPRNPSLGRRYGVFPFGTWHWRGL